MDSSYAPKSPDLSSFDLLPGPTEPELPLHHPQAADSQGLEYKASSTSYLHHPNSSSSNFSYTSPPIRFNNIHHNNHTSIDNSNNHLPHFEHSHRPPPQQASFTPKHQPYLPPTHQAYFTTSDDQLQSGFDSYSQHHEHVQPRQVPAYGAYSEAQRSPAWSTPQPAQSYATRLGPDHEEYTQNAPATPSSSKMPPRKAPPPPPPAIEPSPVRTRFPTARIKRIMQADEEVGKVAQQTPIAVGKALELFMIQLVTRSADIAKEKGSKRVTAPMLKQVVEQDDQWDFLREIVSRVENEKEGKAKAKVESSSEEEEIPEPKRRTRGGRKKRGT